MYSQGSLLLFLKLLNTFMFIHYVCVYGNFIICLDMNFYSFISSPDQILAGTRGPPCMNLTRIFGTILLIICSTTFLANKS